MGHIRLGELPRTRRWDQVVGLIAGEADATLIAAASLDAAEEGLPLATNDEGLTYATWLLTQLPLAAREDDFAARLSALGVAVSANPDVPELLGAFTDAVDDHMRRHGRRSDVGEMAHMAATETLARTLSGDTADLFGPAPRQVRDKLGSLATTKQFGGVARDFVASLIRRYLSFFLSRELSNHVGAGRRFANLGEHGDFDRALNLHCRQAARIVEDFAGGWFSKTNWKEGISPKNTRGFLAVALKKVKAELRRGAGRRR